MLGVPAVPQPNSSANVSASHELCQGAWGVQSPPPRSAHSIFVLFVNRYLYKLALYGVCDRHRSRSSCEWCCTRMGRAVWMSDECAVCPCTCSVCVLYVFLCRGVQICTHVCCVEAVLCVCV